MITLKSHGGQTVSCTLPQGSLTVFPADKKAPKGDKTFALLSAPEETAESSVISWPGEYDYAGISIKAIGQEEGKHVSYVVTSDGLRVGFLSSPLKEWGEHEIERLGDLDVLVLGADDPKRAQHIVEEVDPPVVIPLKNGDTKNFDKVVEACGEKGEAVKEVKLKKSSLPKEGRDVYVLKS